MNRDQFKKIVKAKTGRKALIAEVMRVLHCGKNTACEKLNGRRSFKAEEVDAFRVEYELTDAEVVDIFIKEVEADG